MVFNSLTFLVFFAVVLALYYRLGLRAQNGMLLGASYLFYGWWDCRFLGLLIFTSLFDYPKSGSSGERLHRNGRTFFILTLSPPGIHSLSPARTLFAGGPPAARVRIQVGGLVSISVGEHMNSPANKLRTFDGPVWRPAWQAS
jgi:hypothetical protein